METDASRKLREDLQGVSDANERLAGELHRERQRADKMLAQRDQAAGLVRRLLGRLAEAEKFVILAPDPEIVAAVADVEKFLECFSSGVIVEFDEESAALEQRLAEAEELVGLAPDPEVATAVFVVNGLMDSIRIRFNEEERAALRLLINRASGVTVLRLREEVAAWRAEVMRLRGELVKALALTRAQAAAYDERLADREQTIATLQDREACADVDAEATERDAARWRALRSADVLFIGAGTYGEDEMRYATDAEGLEVLADELIKQAAATGGEE